MDENTIFDKVHDIDLKKIALQDGANVNVDETWLRPEGQFS